MIRIFCSVQACFFVTALAQPIDARDELILPMNPPKKASPAHGTLPAPQKVLSIPVAPSNTPTKLPAKPAFQITNTEVKGGDTETMEIRTTISRLSSKLSNPSEVRVICHVYESDAAGKIFTTQSQVNSSWTSPPIDSSQKPCLSLLLCNGTARIGSLVFWNIG